MTERVFCSAWHLFLTVIHFQEIKRHHTKTGKFLSFGAAVWHLDATVNDFRGTETYLKRGFKAAGRILGLAPGKARLMVVPLAHKSMGPEAS